MHTAMMTTESSGGTWNQRAPTIFAAAKPSTAATPQWRYLRPEIVDASRA
jgi:hypothetical protein